MNRAIATLLPVLCVLTTSCDDEWHHVFRLQNAGVDNIHLFLPEFEEKGRSNRIEPERSREYVVKVEKAEGNDGVVYRIEAHRGESLMASTTCPPTDGDTDFIIEYTDAPSLGCRIDP